MLTNLGEVQDEEYVMTGDSDIETLHNRLNPPGVLAIAHRFFGGISQGYYSGEEIQTTEDEPGMNPKYIAELLSVDDDNALAVLRLLDSCEAYEDHPAQPIDLFSLEISQEDMVANSLKALKTIFGWTKAAAGQIFNEMTNYELAARYIAFHAENVSTLASDRRKNSQYDHKPLVINTRIANLSVRYAPVKDVASLIVALRGLSNVTKDYFSYNDDSLLNLVDRLPSLVGDLGSLQTALNNVSPAKLFRTQSFYPSDKQGFYVTPHLLGCHRISIKTQETSNGLDARYSVRLVPSDISPRPLPTSIEFKRFNIPALEQCLKQIVDIAEYLQEINTVMTRQRRMARMERIALLTQRLAKEIEAGGFDSERHRSVIALINQYNDWITSPYKELYGLVCRNLRAALNVCEINAM